VFFLFPFSIAFLGITIYSLQLVFNERRARGWKAALPFAVCVLMIVIFIPLGTLVSTAVFAYSLPSYEAIVRKVESGSIEVHEHFETIPQATQKARLTYRVDAKKDASGVVRVIFWTEFGFPTFHSGYLYSSSGKLDSDLKSRWPITEQVRSNWFYISN
jgi:ABC-type transport system involved in multi-copper enzyme maturation permease subunit